MSRPTNISKIMTFDSRGFTRELDKAMQKAARQIASELVKQAKANVAAIPFKPNPVKVLKGGSVEVTSDAQRKAAVLNSIVREKVISLGTNIVGTTVHAIGLSDFKDTHIGIYYEYGTGEKALNMPGTLKIPRAGALNTSNRYRTGKHIVSRSRHIDYCGMGKGVWIDMGGNIRVTGSREAGRRTPGFIRYIGEDVQAYLWFTRAMQVVGTERVQAILTKNLADFNPTKFLRINPVIRL